MSFDRLIASRTPQELRQRLLRLPTSEAEGLSATLLDAFHTAMRSDRPRAKRIANATRLLARVTRDRAHAACADRMLGLIDHLEGRPGSAARRLERSVAYFRSASMWIDAGDLHRILIDVRMLADDDAAAAREARAALGCYRRGGGADPRRLGSVAMNLGNLHHRRDDYRKALAAYGRARDHFEKSGDPARLANVDYNRANILASLDRVAEARRLYEGAHRTFTDHGQDALAARAAAALAVLDMNQGKFDRSLERLRGLQRQYLTLSDPQGAAHADIDTADVLLCLNRPAEAEEVARRADRFLRKAGHEADSATCSGLIGGANLQAGKPARAVRSFSRAAELQRRLGNPVAAAVHDVGQARAWLRRSRPSEALSLARRAAHTLGRRQLGSKQARALAVAAEAAAAGGRRVDALRAGERARRLARRHHDLRAELTALVAMARAERDAGNRAASYRRLKSAERCVEKLRTGVTSEESRLAFALDKSEVYEELILNRLDVGSRQAIRQALQYAERGKARALAERLAAGNLDWVGAGRGRSRALLARLGDVEERLAAAERALEDPDATPGWRGGASRLRNLTCERETVLASFACSDPARAALVGATPPDPAALIEGLQDNDLVLEFVEAGSQFHLFTVRRDGVDVHRDLASVETIRQAAAALRFQLGKGVLWESHSSRFRGFIAAELARQLRALHDQLLAPVDHLLDGRSVRIVPHGALHGIPMHAFLSGDTPLVERAVVSYAPSLAVLGLLRTGRPASSSPAVVLGVADEAAPLIEREVEVIESRLSRARVFRGEQATGEILGGAQRPSLLHVACHGFFSEVRPWEGALRLGDSWLSLADLYQMEGMADVVVLSGCQTGRGSVYSGDEWVGLVRGFLQAGARAVVASQWEVRDHGTLKLMENFYDGLAAGLPLAEALAAAQRQARRHDDLPLLWAPFVVIGEASLTVPMRKVA